MRTIMVLNAKGGCGKSTLATNIAGYFAHAWHGTFGLIDFDPQGSSLDWLARRPGHLPPIRGYNGYRDGIECVSPDVELLVIDPPARCHGPELERMVGYAETFIVPVQPSPIDIAAASKYVKELYDVHRVKDKEVMYLPRLCEHCLNPTCVASCPSGSIYKREEDGIVLVDQDKCRGWPRTAIRAGELSRRTLRRVQAVRWHHRLHRTNAASTY